MAISAWVAAMPAWVWAVESSPARSAKAGVASSAAAPARNRIFFMGLPLDPLKRGRPVAPDAPSLLRKYVGLPDAALPDAGQVAPQRLGLGTRGGGGVFVLVLLDHRAVEGQPGIGAGARAPDHDVAAMGGGGAFRAAGQGHHRQAGAGAQLDLTLFDAGQGPAGVDNENQLGLLQPGLETEAGRSHAVEARRAPATAGAPQQNAVAAFGAEDEAAFDQLGHDVYGLGALQHGAGGAEGRVASQMIDDTVGVPQQFAAVVGLRGNGQGHCGQGGSGSQFGQGLQHGKYPFESNTA